jgi:hypothetical protein
VIGGPVPQRVGRPVLRTIVLAAIPVALLAALLLLTMPGPSPVGLFNQVVVVHDSALPGRVSAPDPGADAALALLGALSSTLEGQQVDSWIYRFGRDRVSVHRIHGRPPPPRNAGALQAEGGAATLFEVADLSLISWHEAPDRTLVVVGACPVHRLREVVGVVRSEGPGPALDAPTGDDG